jgi:hypothetical protein
MLSDVKLRASAAAKALRLELVRRFPSPKLLSALSIVYPQYYADFAEADFNDHIEALCGFYGSGREVDGATMPALIDPELLRAQAPFFQAYAVEVAQRVKANLDGLSQVTQLGRVQRTAVRTKNQTKYPGIVAITAVSPVTPRFADAITQFKPGFCNSSSFV